MLRYVVLFALSSSVAARFLTQDLDTPTDTSEHAQEHALILALREHISIEAGATSADTRISAINDEIGESWETLEKNSRGAVDATTARYLVHRYFVGVKGWELKGFVTGRGFDSTSPFGDMGARVPSNIKQLFETRVNSTGLERDEVAILIATLEDMVNDAMAARVRAIGLVRNINLQKKKLMKHRAQELLHFFAASWVAGTRLGELTKERVEQDYKVASKSFKRWPKIMQAIETPLSEQGAFISPNEIELAAKNLMKEFQDEEEKTCASMQNQLVNKAIAGRVRLGDFYAASDSESGFEFGESAEWLRSSGALDETDPEDPKVMVSNYILGPSNCMTFSDYHSVCCDNKCSSVFMALEHSLKGPSATPAEIEQQLSKSDLIKFAFQYNKIKFTRANLELENLQKIADVHGGVVPLHGRLFLQYLHHVFPNYCPFPHPPDVVGASAFDGSSPVLFASAEEKERYINVANAARTSAKSQHQSSIASMGKVKVGGHWHEEEHLFSPKVKKTGYRQDAGMHTIMLFGAVGFFGWGIARLATESSGSLHALYGKNVKLI